MMTRTVSRRRSVTKAITYRIVIMTLDFIAIYLFTGTVKIALGFMVASNVYTTVGYFLHERVWARIRLGGRRHLRSAAARSLARDRLGEMMIATPTGEAQMDELEIIGIGFSNYVRTVRMLCEEKGVAYKLNPAPPRTPEVSAIHPAGQVPCMRHGDLTLFESQAIATYIDKAFPGPRFIPEDAVGAARVVQWTSYGNVKVDRWIMREFVVPSVFFDKAKGPDQPRINAALPEIEKCLTALETGVANTGYLVGNDLTYADMNVLPMLVTFGRFPQGKEQLAGRPNLSAFIAKLAARRSFTNTDAPSPRS